MMVERWGARQKLYSVLSAVRRREWMMEESSESFDQPNDERGETPGRALF